MNPILKHNLEHNGLYNNRLWIGFRFEDREYGLLEIDERNEGYPDKWYYHLVEDPENGNIPRYSISTLELIAKYADQLERFVKKILEELS